MAIPRRLRYEVLRRDNFRCRYCGASAEDTTLHVDHVVPEVLGGDTIAENLAAACQACNAGKASTSPDDAVVANVKDDAIRWAKAMQQAAILRAADRQWIQLAIDFVDQAWNEWGMGEGENRVRVPRPANWVDSVERFFTSGIAEDELARLVGVAMRNAASRSIPSEEVWTYFCGCCWREIDKLQEHARHLLEGETP